MGPAHAGLMHWQPSKVGAERSETVKHYRFKLAIISGLYYRTVKAYLKDTRRFTVIGYERIYY